MIHIIVSYSRSGRTVVSEYLLQTQKIRVRDERVRYSLFLYLIMFTFVNERVIQFTVFVRVDLLFANAKFTVTSSNATNSR